MTEERNQRLGAFVETSAGGERVRAYVPAPTCRYRNSLTEIVQIIGRATRDAPGKPHAQFTNLVAEPGVETTVVADAVNDMLKAISGAMLMEQVLAPNFKFYRREDGDIRAPVETTKDGTVHIGIKGLLEPANAPRPCHC